MGSGKTAVAAALCWAVIQNGMQAALMAPTEILATQHYHSLNALLEPAHITCALLTGSVKAAEKKDLPGPGRWTHPAGHRHPRPAFGKGGIRQPGAGHHGRAAPVWGGAAVRPGPERCIPHLLVMSATPIPRTLALMVYGDLDISVLDELPPGRQKIETYLIGPAKRDRAFGYVQKHLDQGRQGYLICPLIEEDESGMQSVTQYAEMVEKAFPSASVGVLHGKMKPAEKSG